jgi:glutathione synthase
MRLGLVVNDVLTEAAGYTTTRLAVTALALGHEVWQMGVGDLAYDPDDKIRARARAAPRTKYKTTEAYLKDLQGKSAKVERICVDDLDALLLRNDPAPDSIARPWAASAGILFGRMAMRHGVIVLNDPNGLAKATNKMYFQAFPEEVRPQTLITRDRQEIRAFAKERGGSVVLKPLSGSGGQSVFLVRPEDVANMNQMIDAVSRDGYVIAQEYLSAAEEGDLRLFLLNGQPLRYKGKYAAFRRVRHGGDMRSNVHAGGKLAQAEIGSNELRIAEIVRPKIVQDGMFLVGLDIVGDKLMEINVFSPGGLGSAQKFEKVNFGRPVISALERKVQYMEFYRRNFDNDEMATL